MPDDFGGYRPQLYLGYGMDTVGGRGPGGGVVPVVILVNTLSDNNDNLSSVGGSGTATDPYVYRGSLRAALRCTGITVGPRFVLFEVGGYINLTSDIEIIGSYLTIAGQTAPSPGITVRNYGLYARNGYQHIVCQHFRIRPGANGAPACANCFTAWTDTDYILMDHMSMSWGKDENIDFTPGEGHGHMTFWRSITSENLYQPPGCAEDGHGILIAAGTKDVAMIQSLTAHNQQRNPYVQAGVQTALLNNIIFNWYKEWGIFCSNTTEWGVADRRFRVSAVGNRFIRGPQTVNPSDEDYANMFYYDAEDNNSASVIYRVDNTLANDPDNKIIEQRLDPDMLYDPNVFSPPAEAPLPTGYVPIGSTQLEGFLLSQIGARPLDRDAVDTRIISEVIARSHVYSNYATNESSYGGFPTLQSTSRSISLPADPFVVPSGFRTNLENWLESDVIFGAQRVEITQLGADYYISTTGSDSNDGFTPDTAFATIQHAYDVLRGLSNYGAGRIVQMRGGTYDQYLGNVGANGQANAYIKLQNYPNEVVWLRPTSAGVYYVMWLTGSGGGASYLEFDGINMDGTYTSGGAVKLEGNLISNGGIEAHHLRFMNLTIFGPNTNVVPSTGVGWDQISMQADSPSHQGGMEFLRLILYGGHAGSPSYGTNPPSQPFYINMSNVLIDLCEVYDTAGAGFQVYSSPGLSHHDITISNNFFHDIRRYVATDPYRRISVGAIYGPHDGIKVFNNRFVDCGASGALTRGLFIAQGATNPLIFNNLFANLAGVGLMLGGDGGVTGGTVRNNGAWNCSPNYQQEADAVGMTIDHNVNFTAPYVDPQFLDTLYHIASDSLFRGQGIPSGFFTTDMDGDTRGASVWDVGPDEYNNVIPTPQELFEGAPLFQSRFGRTHKGAPRQYSMRDRLRYQTPGRRQRR